MSNMAFGTDNIINNSTFTLLSGTENSQYPLTNISKSFTTKIFRSTGSGCTLQIDFGQNVTLDTVMIVGNNLTGLGVDSATIEFSPTTVFPGTAINTIDLSSDHNFGFKYVTSGSYRYAKLVLTGTSYCELSNLYIGQRTEIANNNIDVSSFSYSIKENFKTKRNNYGQEFTDTYNTVNELSGTIKYVNLVEFEQLNNLYSEVGNTTPMWFIFDSSGDLSTDGSSKYLFSGYFRISNTLVWKMVAPKLYDTVITLKEVV